MKCDLGVADGMALGTKMPWAWASAHEVQRQSSALGGSGLQTSLNADSAFFRSIGSFQQHDQFLCGGPAQPVKPQRLDGAFVGTLARPQHEQEGGDQDAINLGADAGGRFGQPVAAVEDGLDPLEEQFDLPALAVNQTDQFGGQILPRGDC